MNAIVLNWQSWRKQTISNMAIQCVLKTCIFNFLIQSWNNYMYTNNYERQHIQLLF